MLNSTSWLRYSLGVLLNSLLIVPLSNESDVKRVGLRDASVISRPDSPGTEWRVHLSWYPFDFQPAQVTVTDAYIQDILSSPNQLVSGNGHCPTQL